MWAVWKRSPRKSGRLLDCISYISHTLDPETLDHLQKLENANGRGYPGVFAARWFGVGKTINGLLRGYDASWTIVVRPHGADKTHVIEFDSEPLTKLTYTETPNDPSWATYAVILYSAFYDMSSRMIANFALDPGRAPNSYSFADATGTVDDSKVDKPDPFGLPKNPLDFPKPKLPFDPFPKKKLPLFPGDSK